MLDITPLVGESHPPENLLDALLVVNRDELRSTMTEALDTETGLQVLAPLRTGASTEIEDGGGQATTPLALLTDPAGARGDGALPIGENTHKALELVDDFLVGLEEVRRSQGMPVDGRVACMDCAEVLEELSLGLEERSVTRNEAKELLAEANGHMQVLGDLASETLPSEGGWVDTSTSRLIASLIQQLETLTRVVVRMFDDAHDNVSVES
ncbi:hypothetical protein ACWGJ0_36140 [Streptomyces massasporeus]